MTAALAASLVLSLALTEVLELLFARLWGLRGWDLRLVLLMNLLTNPPVVTAHFLLCVIGPFPRLAVIPVLEGLAVLVEGLCCRHRGEGIAHPWRFALCVNLFSYTAGALLQIVL